MEISRPVAAFIILLLVASVATPIFFLSVPSDERTIEFSLSYKYRDTTFTVQSGSTSEESTTGMTFSVNRRNWTTALFGESFKGYPLWLNVSSWHILDNVYIGTNLTSVINETIILRYDCWEVEIDNETYAYYCRNTGLFIYARYSHWETTGFLEYWGVTHEYSLSSENLNALDSIFVLTDGWLVSGILLQLVALIVIVEYRRSKSE